VVEWARWRAGKCKEETAGYAHIEVLHWALDIGSEIGRVVSGLALPILG